MLNSKSNQKLFFKVMKNLREKKLNRAIYMEDTKENTLTEEKKKSENSSKINSESINT